MGMEAEEPITSKEYCSSVYGTGFKADKQICAGWEKGGIDSCQGDSGGPLVCQLNSTLLLSGVISTGYKCALPKIPALYTRVTFFASWIKNIISRYPFIDTNSISSYNYTHSTDKIISPEQNVEYLLEKYPKFEVEHALARE